MKKSGWDIVILDDPEHAHLVAEVHHDGEFICLLNREMGRDSLAVEFAPNGAKPIQVALREFIDTLEKAAEDLKR